MSRPVGHTLTPYGSPMHIAQLTLVLLKATFANLGGDNYPFKYTKNVNTTGIVIDTSFNKNSKIFGIKPLLVVSREAVTGTQLSPNDIAYQSIKTLDSIETSMISSSVSVKILSKDVGEVDILSAQVFNFLFSCRNSFQALLGVHQAQTPTLSPIIPYEQDDKLFFCTATLPYIAQYKWTHTVPQNILEQIDLYTNDDPTVFLNDN